MTNQAKHQARSQAPAVAHEAHDDAVVHKTLASLHHAYFLGLQLMVSTREGPSIMGDWMFRLFRRQHEEKFLSSFAKLGLDHLPDAVACAQYHVLSNGVGGVPVEYMYESDQKAWVRFRYPRWMFDGPTICGVTQEVSQGFLSGWYAHNGVSLNNPRLGFVCVSQDMTGEYGLCGYFKEYDHNLTEDQRLVFAEHERPPAAQPQDQPAPPSDQWTPQRLAKANRNYAMEYVRNGLITLAQVLEQERATELGALAAELIGLQYYRESAAALGIEDEGLASGGEFLRQLFAGMGDEVVVSSTVSQLSLLEIRHSSLRILRGLPPEEKDLVLRCWQRLWCGALKARTRMISVTCHGNANSDELSWRLELN